MAPRRCRRRGGAPHSAAAGEMVCVGLGLGLGRGPRKAETPGRRLTEGEAEGSDRVPRQGGHRGSERGDWRGRAPPTPAARQSFPPPRPLEEEARVSQPSFPPAHPAGRLPRGRQALTAQPSPARLRRSRAASGAPTTRPLGASQTRPPRRSSKEQTRATLPGRRRPGPESPRARGRRGKGSLPGLRDPQPPNSPAPPLSERLPRGKDRGEMPP